LEQAGYIEGRNVLIEYRWAEGRYDRLPALVADLLDRRVAVIASTGGPPVVEAAAAATTTVPIVFLSSDVILKTGVIASLNRPSRNVTGVVMSTSALLSKCLQFLGELVPKDATIGILVNPNVSDTAEAKENIQTAARQIGRQFSFSPQARKRKSMPPSPRSPSGTPAAWSSRAIYFIPTAATTSLRSRHVMRSQRSICGVSSPQPAA
jgi:hypothetical protein